MKRNWSKLSEVLGDVEADRIEERLRVLDSSGDKQEEDLYFGHLLLALDANLVSGLAVDRSRGEWFYGLNECRLTMAGHDFLDAMRSKAVWNRVKEIAVQSAIPITVDLVKSVLAKSFQG